MSEEPILPNRTPGAHLSEALNPDASFEQNEPADKPLSPWAPPTAGEAVDSGLPTPDAIENTEAETQRRNKEREEHKQLGRDVLGLSDGRPVFVKLVTDKDHIKDKKDRNKAEKRVIELERQLEQDKQTELLNKEGFLNAVNELLKNGETDIAVLYLDLEGFKQVNDKLGHDAGDLMLMEFADRLREEDIAARLGGDEFAVALPGFRRNARMEMTDIERTARTKHRFRKAAQEAGRALGADLSTSVGMVLAVEGSTAEQLLKAADAAMYEDKRARQQKSGIKGLFGRLVARRVKKRAS